MPARTPLVDLSTLDLSQVIADKDAIRARNPQRFEMEQLDAIIHDNAEDNTCVGFKDITDEEFWVRGHMPGLPLMPGVVMCEAAAQLCSYHTQRHDLLGCEMVGFGGLNNVKFRGMVLPGRRLYLLAKLYKVRRGILIKAQFQGICDETIVVEGDITGIALPVDALSQAAAAK